MKRIQTKFIYLFPVLFLAISFTSIVACKKKNDIIQNYDFVYLDEDNEKTQEIAANRFGVNDPLAMFAWHVFNFGQVEGVKGIDAGVMPAWFSGYKGEGTTIRVVDDGVDVDHEDLIANMDVENNYNFETGTNLITDKKNSEHGTCVSGIISAVGDNNKGAVGVAYNSRFHVMNFLSAQVETGPIEALTKKLDSYDVSNNSWGSAQKGHFVYDSSDWDDAVNEAITKGRAGKGSLILFAAGNDRHVGKSEELLKRSGYEQYTNHLGVITVAAVGSNGVYAPYSEPGANIWITAPSEGSNHVAITTSDVSGGEFGLNTAKATDDYSDKNYTKKMNGTSAAAPVASGVTALVLQANKNLTWRDVKAIYAKTSLKVDPENLSWRKNRAGVLHSDDYGFGLVSAEKAIEAAKTWTNLSPILNTGWLKQTTGELSIPKDGNPISSTIEISESEIKEIEFVEVIIDLTHSNWGDLEISLERDVSEVGGESKSILASQHRCFNEASDNVYKQAACQIASEDKKFHFSTVKHFGENPVGKWNLKILDKGKIGDGVIRNWEMKIYGHK